MRCSAVVPDISHTVIVASLPSSASNATRVPSGDMRADSHGPGGRLSGLTLLAGGEREIPQRGRRGRPERTDGPRVRDAELRGAAHDRAGGGALHTLEHRGRIADNLQAFDVECHREERSANGVDEVATRT